MENLTEVLQRYGQERTLSPGEVLFRQGSVSDGVYYLKSGRLGVYREEQDGVYLLKVVAPGEMVGEMGAATGRARTATVMCGEQSCVIHVSDAEFRRAMNEAPTLAAEVIVTVGDRLADADLVLVTLGQSYRQAVHRVQALRSQKEQLEELLRLREELAGVIVHDLRNPLGVISSGLELLEEVQAAEGEREFVAAVMDMMRRSAGRMQRLVDTLLDITRLEAGEMGLQLAPVDLRALVGEVVAEERPLAEHAGVALESRLPTGLPPVLADADVLQRVLIHLLENALKGTPTGGRVGVSACREGEGARVEVVDTGPSIPVEQRQRIFEKFAQVEGSGRARRGLGVELAFCRMAVEAHGGRIWVEDGPGGQGRCFAFTLPPIQT